MADRTGTLAVPPLRSVMDPPVKSVNAPKITAASSTTKLVPDASASAGKSKSASLNSTRPLVTEANPAIAIVPESNGRRYTPCNVASPGASIRPPSRTVSEEYNPLPEVSVP